MVILLCDPISLPKNTVNPFLLVTLKVKVSPLFSCSTLEYVLSVSAVIALASIITYRNLLLTISAILVPPVLLLIKKDAFIK